MTLTCGRRLRLRGGRCAGTHPSVTHNLYIHGFLELYAGHLRVYMYDSMCCMGEGERKEKIGGVGGGDLGVKRPSAVSESLTSSFTPSRS